MCDRLACHDMIMGARSVFQHICAYYVAVMPFGITRGQELGTKGVANVRRARARVRFSSVGGGRRALGIARAILAFAWLDDGLEVPIAFEQGLPVDSGRPRLQSVLEDRAA